MENNKNENKGTLKRIAKILLIIYIVVTFAFTFLWYLLGMVLSISFYTTGTAFLFTAIVIALQPLTLVIDNIGSSLYEITKKWMPKQPLLFVCKTMEALFTIWSIHLLNGWMKGVNCSIMAEVVMGFLLYLFYDVALTKLFTDFSSYVTEQHKKEVGE